MMTGKTYMDGLDIFDEYQIFITTGGYNSLISFPPTKPARTNDWPEYDGIEVDLSDQILDSKKLLIAFAGTGDGIESFVGNLAFPGAYHLFNFAEIGKIVNLRMISQQSFSQHAGLSIFSIEFADDFPLFEYTYNTPVSTVAAQGYTIDGKSLSDYGVSILQGSDDEIAKSPVMKENLIRKFDGRSGLIYDNDFAKFKSKEVVLFCLLTADTISEFWQNYNALLFDLIKPGERTLYEPKTGKTIKFYYKRSSVSAFYPDGKVWCQFSITLEFPSFRT